MTSHIPEGYRAVKETAGWVDLSARGKVLVTGPDRLAFLQAMTSNDVLQLPDYSGMYTLLLKATGKIVADLYCYRLPDTLLLDTEQGTSGRIVSELEKFIVMDDVQVREETTDWGHVGAQGPGSPELVVGFLTAWQGEPFPLGSLPFSPLDFVRVNRTGVALHVISKPTLGDSGFDVLFPGAVAAKVMEVWQRIVEPFPRIEEEAAELLRIERGIPRFGLDFTARNNPIEAGLQNAISFTKGCYVGQEVVSKATYVGGVSRLLVRLGLRDDTPARPGAEIIEQNGKKVGTVTSSVYSPGSRRVLAFGYVKRAMATTGRRCLVTYPDGRLVEAEVLGR